MVRSGSGKVVCNVCRRLYSTTVSVKRPRDELNMQSMSVFDQEAKRLQRLRASKSPNVADFDFLKEEIGYRLSDRVLDISRTFKDVVDLGCGRGFVSRHLTKHSVSGTLHLLDDIGPLLESCELPHPDEGVTVQKRLLSVDDCKLPFPPNSIDLVVSNMRMHWINDLPALIADISRTLSNDGVFIGCMFGGETLYELRTSMQLADVERSGGVAPHISPFVTPNDLTALLSQANFRLITIDVDEMPVKFGSVMALLQDLRGMGETGATHNRLPSLQRDNLLATTAIYNELYPSDDVDRPGIVATFQVLYWIGWKPDPTQPRPLPPNIKSDISLKDINQIDDLMSTLSKDTDNVK